MKVDYLFSRRNRWGSKMIAWASSKEDLSLQEIPSHMAVLLDDTVVIESTFTTGVRMIPYEKWSEINEELYSIPCERHYRHSRNVLEKAYSVWGAGYDWKGIIYFAYCFVRLILLGDALPSANKWQRENKYFCTEFAARLVDEDFSMMTPAKICDTWLNGVRR